MAQALDPAVETALRQLQEIALPTPVAYVPQTIGWAIVGVLLLLALVFVAWRIVRHRRLNAYRREALAELDLIERQLLAQPAPTLPSAIAPSIALPPASMQSSPASGGGNQKGSTSSAPPSARRGGGSAGITRRGEEVGWGALPALLKRTAIAATSREEVASLSGEEWLRFLDRSLGNGRDFEQGVGRLLVQLAYSPKPPSTSSHQLESLVDLSRRWIRHHHADV